MKTIKTNVLELVILCVIYFVAGVFAGFAYDKYIENKMTKQYTTCSHEYTYEEYVDNEGNKVLRETRVPALNECKEDK